MSDSVNFPEYPLRYEYVDSMYKDVYSTEILQAGLLTGFIANLNSRGTWDRFTDLLGRYRTAAVSDILEAVEAAT